MFSSLRKRTGSQFIDAVLYTGNSGAAELPQGDAQQEAANVKNARERAQEAAQPE